MKAIQLFSPAKINLFLSVLGLREDGFHELLSLVCPLDFGDYLHLTLCDEPGDDSLQCDSAEVPTDSSNLILQAVEMFRQQHYFSGRVLVKLKKQIPMGAGLGGGSSNASTTLWGLNSLLGSPLGLDEVLTIAEGVGSDCPLFLHGGAVVLRGRGELVSSVPLSLCDSLSRREVLLLVPGLHVSTPWAYNCFREQSEAYDIKEDSEQHLARYISGSISHAELLRNNFEPVVFSKFVGLHALKKEAQSITGSPVLLSGSGSTLFLLLPSGVNDIEKLSIIDQLKEAFGGEFGLVKTGLAPFPRSPLNFFEDTNPF